MHFVRIGALKAKLYVARKQKKNLERILWTVRPTCMTFSRKYINSDLGGDSGCGGWQWISWVTVDLVGDSGFSKKLS